MCESGLRTIRCKDKSLKGGFFCVCNLSQIILSKIFISLESISIN